MTVNAPMFFWASPNERHAKFFCIMSWSSPVMATVTNIPAKMCLSQWLLALQSSVTQIRVMPVSDRAEGKSSQPCPPACKMPPTVMTTAKSMQAVCRVSVQITVPMPLRRV